VDGCAAGGPARRCRRGCTTLSAVAGVRSAGPAAAGVHKPRPLSERPDRRCPPAARDLARNPAGSAEPDTAAVSAVRRRVWPGAGRTAAVHRGHGRSPAQGGDRAAAGSRPSMHPRRRRQWHRPPPADTARVAEVLAELRPPGDAVRTAGRWPRNGCPVGCGPGRYKRPRSTAASGNRGRCPDGRCPPGTLPQSAGVGCYRNRSPARRPLDGCRHCREAWASWRPSRSQSWART
jgi:hypothetical protein